MISSAKECLAAGFLACSSPVLAHCVATRAEAEARLLTNCDCRRSAVINKRLHILLARLFVVMIGLGITQPVLPFLRRAPPAGRRRFVPGGRNALRLYNRRARPV